MTVACLGLWGSECVTKAEHVADFVQADLLVPLLPSQKGLMPTHRHLKAPDDAAGENGVKIDGFAGNLCDSVFPDDRPALHDDVGGRVVRNLDEPRIFSPECAFAKFHKTKALTTPSCCSTQYLLGWRPQV
jgi:hypothetical protein